MHISLSKLRRMICLCALMLGTLGATALACEPCLAEKSLTLEQSIAQADLIVVGYRLDHPAKPEQEGETPKQVKVQVMRVLRGSVKENQIMVRSYSGMCPYGVVLPDKEHYVLILKATGDGQTYSAVDRCSVKALRVTNDAAEIVTLDEYTNKTLPLDALLLATIAPPEYRRAVELLQYLRNSGERDGGSGFEASRGGNWKTDKLLSFVSRNGLTLYDVNDKRRTRRLTRSQLSNALSHRGNRTFAMFTHLGYIYAQAYPQYSTLRYKAQPSGVVVEMSGWYRLTFKREDGTLKLTKLEYLMLEED
jgi:hypothetical protein